MSDYDYRFQIECAADNGICECRKVSRGFQPKHAVHFWREIAKHAEREIAYLQALEKPQDEPKTTLD